MSYLVFPVHLSLLCTSLDMNHIYLPFVFHETRSVCCVLKSSLLHSSHKGVTMLPKQSSELNSSQPGVTLGVASPLHVDLVGAVCQIQDQCSAFYSTVTLLSA